MNGFAGLRWWKEDAMAGALLWIVALVYCLGISEMSGFPLIAGVWTAIIAGVIFPLVGGSHLTISGPGIGLAPLMMWTVMSMGHGDKTIGHERAIVVVFLVGLLMTVLSYCKVARLGKYFPLGVIHGMLAAIGLLAVAKQLPHFLGVTFHGHHFRELLAEVPEAVGRATGSVMLIAAVCLVALLVLDRIRTIWLTAGKPQWFGPLGVILRWWLGVVPPQVSVVLVGFVLSLGVGLPPQFLARIPASITDGFTFPDFAGVLHDSSLWVTCAEAVVLLLLVDGVESVATVLGIDSIDPDKRTSDPDRIWRAMGMTNMIGSLFGCMPVIPGGMKSTLNVQLGAKTLNANFFTAMFLLLALLFASSLISLLPMAVLAAVLMQVGCKLTYKMYHKTCGQGWEEWLLFWLTAGTTLLTDDLVVGIGAGLGAAGCCWVGKLFARAGHLSASAASSDSVPEPELILQPIMVHVEEPSRLSSH